MNLDDLRIFLRAARHGSFSAAAGELRLSVATVSRRLDALEEALGVPLMRRTPRGLSLTQAGEALARQGAEFQQHSAALERFAASLRSGQGAGFVRVSATEPVIAHLLAPCLANLPPALRLELRVENSIVALSLNDADIAIRLAPPANSASLMTRRLKPLAMGVFGAPALLAGRDISTLPCIGYDDSHGPIPERQWMDTQAILAAPSIRTSSTQAMLNAASSGAVLAILPALFARRMGLVEASGLPPVPPRHAWIVWHRDLNRRAPIRAAITWIANCFAAAQREQASYGLG